MAKIIDITEKLSFEENPKLVIKGKQYEVNADAKTVLRIMGLVSGETSPEQLVEAFDLVFTKTAKKHLEELHLQFADYQTVVLAAINLIVGSEDTETGE